MVSAALFKIFAVFAQTARFAAASSAFRLAFVSESGSERFKKGVDFGVRYINEVYGGIPVGRGPPLPIEIVEYDTGGDKEIGGQAALAVQRAAAGVDASDEPVGEIHAIVAGTASTNSAIRTEAQIQGIPNVHVSGGNPLDWKAENTFAFGMHLPFVEYTKGPMKLFQIAGMKTIGIIRTERHGFSRTSCVAALKWAALSDLRVVGPTPVWCASPMVDTTSCQDVGGQCRCGGADAQSIADDLGLGITLADGPTFYEVDEDSIGNGFQGGSVDEGTVEYFRAIIRDMVSQGAPDVILNFAHEWHNVLQAMVLEDFTPKVLLGWQGGVYPDWAADSTGVLGMEYGYWAMGFGQWHRAIRYYDPVFGSNQAAVAAYEQEFGILGYDTAGGIATAVVFYVAMKSYADASWVNESLVAQRDAVRLGIGDMNDETMWGPVRFNRNNQNNGRGTAAWQVQADVAFPGRPARLLSRSEGPIAAQQLCVLPLEAAEAELVYPLPAWDVRLAGCQPGHHNTGYSCEPCGIGAAQGVQTPGIFAVNASLADVFQVCSPCPAGQQGNGTGLSNCSECPQGFYKDEASTAMCSQCPVGRVAPQPGATDCVAVAPDAFRLAFVSESGSERFKQGIEFGIKYINYRYGGIPVGGGRPLPIELVEYDTGGDKEIGGQAATAVRAAASGMGADGVPVGNIHAIVAGTAVTNSAIRTEAQIQGVPNVHVSGGNPLDWKAANNFAFGMHLPFIEYTKGPMKLFEMAGMKSIGIIRTQRHGFSRTSCVAALKWAELSNLTVVGPTPGWCSAPMVSTTSCQDVGGHCRCGGDDAQSIADNLGLGITLTQRPTFYEVDEDKIGNGFAAGVVDSETVEYFRGILRDMASQGAPDVILNFAHEWHNVLQAMVLEDFTPKVLLGWQGGVYPDWAEDSTGLLSQESGYWAMGFGQWHRAVRYPDPVFGSNEEAVELFEKEFGTLGYDTAGGIATAVVFYVAMQKYAESSWVDESLASQRDAIRLAIGSMNDDTLWGPVRFNRNNQNNGRGTAAWQVQADVTFPGHEQARRLSGFPRSIAAQQLCVLPLEAAEAVLVHPFPSWDVRFAGCKPGSYSDGYSCKPCDIGTVQPRNTTGLFVANASLEDVFVGCSPCPAGKQASASGSSDCSSCPVGFYKAGNGSDLCIACAAGRVAPLQGGTVCGECREGTFQNQPGQGVCTNCSQGTFAGSTAATECSKCTQGKVTVAEGQKECQPCGVGTYHLEDEVACTECPVGQITLELTLVQGEYQYVPKEQATEQASCGCGASFRLDEPSGACVTCGEASETGLVCLGKDDIKIAPGFYAESGSLSVYSCFGDDLRCPGGRPGSTCAANREGISCTYCKPGFMKSHTGDCIECASDGSDQAMFWTFCIALVVFLVIMYIGIDRRGKSAQSHALLLLALTLSLIVTLVQQLGIVAMFKAISWQGPMIGLLDSLSLFQFNVDILNMNCIYAVRPVQLLLTKLGLIGMSALIILVSHVVVVFTVHEGNFKERNPSLVGSVGTLLMAFYISVVTLVLGPLQCMRSPNGKWLATEYQGTVCWEEEEHVLLVVIGMLALMMPLAFLAQCSWVTYRFPRWMREGHVTYLRSYTFLFYRYKADTYWYCMVHMFRSLLLGLTPIVPSVSAQVLGMQILLTSQLACIIAYKPWRVGYANWLDALFTSAGMFVLSCSSFYVEGDPGQLLGWFSFIFIFVCLLCLPFVAALTLYSTFQQRLRKEFQFFLCHHKAGAGAFVRLLKIELQTTRGVSREVFVDCDNLTDLDALFDQVAYMVETLVVIGTKMILTRPWCLGEITTTFLKSINLVKMTLPDYQDPDDDFIAYYDSSVADISVLSSRGISMEDAREAMRWLRSLPAIGVDLRIDDRIVKSLVKDILGGQSVTAQKSLGEADGQNGKCDSSVGIGRHSTNSTASGQDAALTNVCILCDTENLEAMSAALVLKRMLYPHFVHKPEFMPSLALDGKVPDQTKIVMLLCTQGLLEQQHTMETLDVATQFGERWLPILAEDSFRFPSRAALQKSAQDLGFEDSPPTPVDDKSETAGTLVDRVLGIFQAIAVPFLVSMSSELVLTGKAQEIANRIEQEEKKIRGSVQRSKTMGAGQRKTEVSRTLSLRGVAGRSGVGKSDRSDAKAEIDKVSDVDGETYGSEWSADYEFLN